MVDLKEIDALAAQARELSLRKFGVDISPDPRTEKIFTELAEAAIERKQEYNHSIDEFYIDVTVVAAERIAKLEKEIEKLKGK